MHSDVYTRDIFSPGHRYVNKATKMADRCRRRRRRRRSFRCSLSQCATTFVVEDDDTMRTRRRFADWQGLSISMNRHTVRNDNSMSRSSPPAHLATSLPCLRRQWTSWSWPPRRSASFARFIHKNRTMLLMALPDSRSAQTSCNDDRELHTLKSRPHISIS